MGTLFRRVVRGQRNLGNYDLIRSMGMLFRRIVAGQRDLGNYDLIRSMSTLFRRVVAGQRNLGNYDLIRSMSTLFRRVVRGERNLGNYGFNSVYGHPIPQGSPRRRLLPITVGEEGLPDEPTEHGCTAVRPQRGRILASMWSTALARVYPTIGAVFCLHCLHQS